MIPEIRILYIYNQKSEFLLLKKSIESISHQEFLLDGLASFKDLDDKTSKLNYHLFFVDFNLGEDPSINLVQKLKTLISLAPVILFQEKDSNYINQEALKLNVSEFLVKETFGVEDLSIKIKYALRDSESKNSLKHEVDIFSSIFEKAADPFIMIDSLGKILEANPKFSQKFGIDVKSIHNNDKHFFFDFIQNQRDRQFFFEKLGSSVDSFEFEANLIDAAGKPFNGLVSIANHSPKTFQVLIKDFSAIKEKEEAAYNLRKFASTGRIARLLAHEVKNPLTTIMLSADQLRLELPEEIIKESGDLLDVILRNSHRINDLVSQLLNSTRYASLDLENYDINSILTECLNELEDRLELEHFQVVTDFEKNPKGIRVDKEKIKIAFTNLMVNAIEAMKKNEGVLKIKTESIEDGYSIEISDNGIGISKEKLDHLFEPYFTSKANGSGLGLTNTQNIIFSHKGSIRVESEEGKGTRFCIKLQANPNIDEIK